MTPLFELTNVLQTRLLQAARIITGSAPMRAVPGPQGGLTSHLTTSAGAVGWVPEYGGRFVARQSNKASWPEIPDIICEVARRSCVRAPGFLRVEHVSLDWMTGPTILPERISERTRAPSVLVCLGDRARLKGSQQEHLVTSGQVFWLEPGARVPEVLTVDLGSSVLELLNPGHLQLHIRQLWGAKEADT